MVFSVPKQFLLSLFSVIWISPLAFLLSRFWANGLILDCTSFFLFRDSGVVGDEKDGDGLTSK
jgi:hypothetical protein